MSSRARRSPLIWLGALLALYLLVPLVAFLVRLAGSHDRGFSAPGLWDAVRTSVVSAMEPPTTYRPDAPLESLIEAMRATRATGLVITNPDGVLLGEVRRPDAERRLAESRAAGRRPRRRRRASGARGRARRSHRRRD